MCGFLGGACEGYRKSSTLRDTRNFLPLPYNVITPASVKKMFRTHCLKLAPRVSVIKRGTLGGNLFFRVCPRWKIC